MINFFKKNRGQAGIAFVEFAIIVPLIAILTVATIDLCRYLSVRSVVYRGALIALDQACKAPFLDTAPSVLASSSTTRTQFQTVRNDLLWDAAAVAASLVRAPSTQDVTRFIPFSLPNGAGTVAMEYALIRPGDSFTSTDGYVAIHPSLPSGSGATTAWANAEAVLASHPYVVEARVRFKFITPFMPAITFSVKAAGFREIWVRGAKNKYNSTPINITIPTPTPTPNGYTPTPSSGGNRTPAPAPTRTPTPVACTRICGSHQVLVRSSCICYCDIGYCPRGTANPGSCVIGCGG